ncbi:hypothetical protein BKA62DRAFT_424101 [Auriculariales sp. MPI-PUGE-AT-0066]|nr:hypothetical protein BKA62DRAFT_424101 [Auriculariales sp. MPI-PUGE-AT-0066]
MFIFRVIALIALLVVPALASHKVTFYNKCKKHTVRPIYHDVSGKTVHLKALKYNQKTSMTVAEGQHAWRAYGQVGKQCLEPDGTRCTLLECSFENSAFRQCNISRVSGYNLGMKFSFGNKSCKGNYCLSGKCNGDRAFTNPTDGGKSLRQCNAKNVPMSVSFHC